MCRSVWWCVTWVGGVQQGEDEWGGKGPAHVERAEPCHQIHGHHRWHSADEQIQLLSCHASSLMQHCWAEWWMFSRSHRPCSHQVGESQPSLSPIILTRHWWLYRWYCTHRDSQILMHGYKRTAHPRQDVLSSSLQLASGYEHLWFPQEQTWCLSYSMVSSLRGQWQWQGSLRALLQSLGPLPLCTMEGTSLTPQQWVQHPQGDQIQYLLSYKSVRFWTLVEVVTACHCLCFITFLRLHFSPAQGGWLVNRMTSLLVPVAFGYQIQMSFSLSKSCVSVDFLLCPLSPPCPILAFLLCVLHHWHNNLCHSPTELY